MNAVTPLERRMPLHQPGQITWPEPMLRKTCASCTHIRITRTLKDGTVKGFCALVKAHHKVQGVAFDVSHSTACPQIKETVQ